MSDQKITSPPARAMISWILYDFANTAYSMNVVSLYFSTWIILELNQSDIWVSLVNSLSMALVALTMPVLGEWSDKKNKKMPALLIFTAACVLGTFFMGLAGQNMSNLTLLVPFILCLYVLTNYSYQGGLVFYNAMLPVVSTPKTLGRISGYGVAIGYAGSIAGLLIARLFVEGNAFGITLPGVEAGGRVAAFIPTAIMFFLFAIPIFIFVKEPKSAKKDTEKWTIVASYKKVWLSIKSTKKYPGLVRFLIAKFLYEDSIQTVIIFMGVYTQAVMGFSNAQVNLFFIVVIPAAIVGSAICGILTDHYGPKKTLVGVIALWIVCMIIIITTLDRTLFWITGGFVGILMGSTWTAARPLLVTLVPVENLGEFFGLYALSGKVAAIIGPIIWSTTTFIFLKFGDIIKYKAAITALCLFMFAGLLVLIKVPDFHQRQKMSIKN